MLIYDISLSDIHLHKAYDHQIWRVGTSRGVDSNKINQAGAGNAITSRSRDKRKTYDHYQSNYSRQTWLDGKLP